MSAAAATLPDAAHGAPHRGFITLSVMLASIMQALDNTIANVALPRIQGTLSATQDQMSWVLTSYIVAAAIMTPLAGWLAGRLGRRKIFLYSILGFTISSALCGLAQTLPQIVLARLAQGLCGAALIPMSQATLLDINPPERHQRAMTVWVMGVTIGPILGPALGGWLTEQYSWRWVFYINVPFGILSFIGVLTFMKETTKRVMSFDFFGFASLALAVGALQLMLDRGQSNDWFSSLETWIEAGVCGLSLYLFVVHVLTTRKAPFISPALFKDRNFLTGNLFIFLIGVVLFATLALLPPLLQSLLGYPVVLTGMVTAPRGIGTLIAMFIVGRFGNSIDGRYTMATGLTLTAASLWWMTNFYLQMDSNQVVWSGLLQGFGTGCVFAPLSTIAFSTLLPHLRNEGTAFFSLMRNLGSSVGISAVTTLLVRNTQIMHSRLAEHVTPFSDGLTPSLHPGVPTTSQLAGIDALVTQQAAMIAYNNDFKLMLILTVIAIPLVALLRAPRTAAQASQAAIVE